MQRALPFLSKDSPFSQTTDNFCFLKESGQSREKSQNKTSASIMDDLYVIRIYVWFCFPIFKLFSQTQAIFLFFQSQILKIFPDMYDLTTIVKNVSSKFQIKTQFLLQKTFFHCFLDMILQFTVKFVPSQFKSKNPNKHNFKILFSKHQLLKCNEHISPKRNQT